MALPAGRYGVTKNQLLKIKKLPMNTIKLIEEIQEELDTFGTAVTHDSTSVVTDSSDLVESGAVKDIVGWGNKNFLDVESYTQLSSVVAAILDNSTGKMYLTKRGESKYQGVNYYYIFDMFSENTKVKISFDVIAEQATALWSTIGTRRKSDNIFNETISGLDLIVGHHEKEFIVNSNLYLSFLVNGNTTAEGYLYLDNVMVSYDGGTFEPYHESVSDSLEEKADNSVIGTVEGATASKAWSVGEHFIKDGAFCTCTQAIAQGGSFILGTNYTAGDVANSLVYTADYTIPDLSALTWNAPTGSQISFARIATASVLPSNAKVIGAVVCEPWNSGINVMPIITIASNNLNINLVIKQSDTLGSGQITIRLTYIII